jgi:hypothetical protein
MEMFSSYSRMSHDNVSAAAVGHLEVGKGGEPWQEVWSSSR